MNMQEEKQIKMEVVNPYYKRRQKWLLLMHRFTTIFYR
jgi:hypothetical protein